MLADMGHGTDSKIVRKYMKDRHDLLYSSEFQELNKFLYRTPVVDKKAKAIFIEASKTAMKIQRMTADAARRVRFMIKTKPGEFLEYAGRRPPYMWNRYFEDPDHDMIEKAWVQVKNEDYQNFDKEVEKFVHLKTDLMNTMWGQSLRKRVFAVLENDEFKQCEADW